ncbi:MAG: hypothetical protein Q6370_019960 [Candidatus Sigynarchaeota archaeon]
MIPRPHALLGVNGKFTRRVQPSDHGWKLQRDPTPAHLQGTCLTRWP